MNAITSEEFLSVINDTLHRMETTLDDLAGTLDAIPPILDASTTRIAEQLERSDPANLESLAELLPYLIKILEHLPLNSLINTLETITTTQQQPTAGPNYQRTLTEYPNFNWSSIGATVIASDTHGATIVSWHDLEWQRRRHPDFDNAIWFSRYTGETNDDGQKIYTRLITFAPRKSAVRSLPDEITDQLPTTPPTPPHTSRWAATLNTLRASIHTIVYNTYLRDSTATLTPNGLIIYQPSTNLSWFDDHYRDIITNALAKNGYTGPWTLRPKTAQPDPDTLPLETLDPDTEELEDLFPA